MVKYIGWISNAQGELFFHLFDEFGFRYDKTIGDVFSYIWYKNDENFIFWHALIDFRDHKNKDSIELNSCIFLAESHILKGIKYLRGKFFIVPHIKENELKKNIIKLYNLKKQYEEKNNKPSLKEFYNIIQNFNKKITIDVVILKDGLIELSLNNQNKLEMDNKGEKFLFLNVFLIIKSLFHKDRFHHKKHEHINLIIKEGNIEKALKNLIYYIQRYLAEERKKSDNNVSKKNLIGIANYLKVLLLVSKKYFRNDDFLEEKTKHIDTLIKILEAETKNESTIKNFISSSFIAASSYFGVYNILKINALNDVEKKKLVENFLSQLVPELFSYFLVALLIFTIWDYIEKKAYPLSLSDNQLIKFLSFIYYKLYLKIICFTKPFTGKGIFTKNIMFKIRKFIREKTLDLRSLK